jgi:hypothetical protein
MIPLASFQGLEESVEEVVLGHVLIRPWIVVYRDSGRQHDVPPLIVLVTDVITLRKNG